jgi:hypothetical protein
MNQVNSNGDKGNVAVQLAEGCASDTNVLQFMARCVADHIAKDGAAQAFIDNAELQVDLALAYAAAHIKKIDHITATYLTNDEARKAMRLAVFASLNKEADCSTVNLCGGEQTGPVAVGFPIGEAA